MADDDTHLPAIPEFYAGRHIFITGGSGFIGKVLVEKILRSCPDVASVHLLLRAKKGVSSADRLKAMTQVTLFDELKKQRPTALEEKLHVVDGDISQPGLGLSAESREFLLKNVSVVFHAAATVRFDDPLARAILLNVRGTRDLALLAKDMPNLAVFLHVSTTYCNTDRKIIEEKLYPPHADWRVLLAAAEKLDSTMIDTISTKLMINLPNTYTFTKSLAEHCVNDTLKDKPLIIFRPSIVISSLNEPVRGWMDNFNGPVGLVVACGKGIVHISLAREANVADYMPVDLAVKVLLVAAWKRGTQRVAGGTSPPIYNCSSSAVRPVSTGEMRRIATLAAVEYPLNDILWVPAGLMTQSRALLLAGTLLLQVLPSVFVDAALRLKGKKPRLVGIQRRIYGAQRALAPFLLNTWHFKNDAAFGLNEAILEGDRAAFAFDYRDIDIEEYFRWVVIGARRYLLHEDDDTLPAARLHRDRIEMVKNVVLFIGVILFAWLLLSLPIHRLVEMPVKAMMEI